MTCSDIHFVRHTGCNINDSRKLDPISTLHSIPTSGDGHLELDPIFTLYQIPTSGDGHGEILILFGFHCFLLFWSHLLFLVGGRLENGSDIKFRLCKVCLLLPDFRLLLLGSVLFEDQFNKLKKNNLLAKALHSYCTKQSKCQEMK